MIEKTINGIMFHAGAWPPAQNKPTLLFIHGSGNTKNLWREQVDALADCANTMAVDLPGHGGSGGVGRTEVAGYADSLVDLVRNAGVPSPVPCGLSLGGAITLTLLLDHAADFPAGVIMNSGARLKVHQSIFDSIQNDYPSFINLAAKTAVSEKTDMKKIESAVRDWETSLPDVVFGDFDACNRFDVMERAGSIRVPVLVITSEDDKLTPAKYGIFLEEQIKNSRRVHIRECGHLSPLEKPGEVNAALREFIISLRP